MNIEHEFKRSMITVGELIKCSEKYEYEITLSTCELQCAKRHVSFNSEKVHTTTITFQLQIYGIGLDYRIMSHFVFLLVLFLHLSSLICETTLVIVSREEWGARTPEERVSTAPATLVIIHHTFIPGACHNRESCSQAMRAIQNFHMDTRGWSDIGYNFAIGGDAVYEARGWEILGAQAKYHNNHSLGVVFIGNYTVALPSDDMMSMYESLIQMGLANHHIRYDYQLIGHRQVRPTECPGDALYAVIRQWDHWVPYPSGYDESNSTKENSGTKIPKDFVLVSLALVIVTMLKQI